MGTAALSWGTQARIRHLCTQVSSEGRRSVHIGGSCSDTLALMQGLWVPFFVTLLGCTLLSWHEALHLLLQRGVSAAQLSGHSPAGLWGLHCQGSLEGPFLLVILASLFGQSVQAILFHPKNNRIQTIPKDRS